MVEKLGQAGGPLPEEVIARLREYSNVRELQGIIERALIESGSGSIQLSHLHLTS